MNRKRFYAFIGYCTDPDKKTEEWKERFDLMRDWCHWKLVLDVMSWQGQCQAVQCQAIVVNINSGWIIWDFVWSELIMQITVAGWKQKTLIIILVIQGSEASSSWHFMQQPANVQIWASGHFLSGLVKHNRNNNNQLGLYKARLDMLVWLNNWTNIFLPAALCQRTIELFQNQESWAKTLFSVGFIFICCPCPFLSW